MSWGGSPPGVGVPPEIDFDEVPSPRYPAVDGPELPLSPGAATGGGGLSTSLVRGAFGTRFHEISMSDNERMRHLQLLARLREVFELHSPSASVFEATWGDATRQDAQATTSAGPRWKAATFSKFCLTSGLVGGHRASAVAAGLSRLDADQIFQSVCGKGGQMDLMDFAEAIGRVAARLDAADARKAGACAGGGGEAHRASSSSSSSSYSYSSNSNPSMRTHGAHGWSSDDSDDDDDHHHGGSGGVRRTYSYGAAAAPASSSRAGPEHGQSSPRQSRSPMELIERLLARQFAEGSACVVAPASARAATAARAAAVGRAAAAARASRGF